jgi:crotonobetainyl-CoA:carnitine CoA-transferase CaiB-like acyl-CoA transferase
MKLEGVRVLDVSMFLPGPFLTMMMADHGADVIRIEPPEGEPCRTIGPATGGASVWFRNTHRGKRSLALDLKSPAGRAIFLDLAREADVLVEGFRPGVAERLGFDYASIAAGNPRIVHASVSAFGQHGPLAQIPTHDLGVEALSGVLSLNLGADGRPAMPHMPVADINAAMMALTGILMALFRRERTGRGDRIDIAMQDAVLAWLPNAVGPVFAEDRPPDVKNERSWGGHSFYAIYETADRRFVVLSGSEPKFVRALLAALDRPDLIAIASGPPGPAHGAVKEFLASVFRTRTRAAWVEWFGGREICFAPVLDLAEAFHAPQVAAREMLVVDGDGNRHLGIPIKFRNEPGRLDPRLPERGTGSEAIAWRTRAAGPGGADEQPLG